MERLDTREYREYLQSFHWQALRLRMLKVFSFRCNECGGDGVLEVHHRTYDRLGEERDDDLEVLCPPCHKRRHSSLRRDRGLETYMKKRYGDDWNDYVDYDRAQFEFDSWLESHYEEFGPEIAGLKDVLGKTGEE